MSFWGPLIGKPFDYNARGPHAFDCWGLVHFVYRTELGIDLPLYGDVEASDVAAVAQQMADPAAIGPWIGAAEPAPFDVMTCAAPGSRIAGHVGLMINSSEVLHVWRGTNVCVMPVDHMFFAGRVRGFWRHECMI